MLFALRVTPTDLLNLWSDLTICYSDRQRGRILSTSIQTWDYLEGGVFHLRKSQQSFEPQKC